MPLECLCEWSQGRLRTEIVRLYLPIPIDPVHGGVYPGVVDKQIPRLQSLGLWISCLHTSAGARTHFPLANITMAVALVATTCILLFGRAAARADLSALRNPDTWPSPGSGSGLTADLGYGLYQGYNNATSGLNIWKG